MNEELECWRINILLSHRIETIGNSFDLASCGVAYLCVCVSLCLCDVNRAPIP